MIRWEKTSKTISADGTTIAYRGIGTNITIESRKRHIPHAGGRSGTWDFTSYFVLDNGKEVAERHQLSAAKEYAERLWKEAAGESAGKGNPD